MQKYLIHHLADLPQAEIIFGEQVIRIINSGMLTDTQYHVCINGRRDRFQPMLDELAKLYQITVTIVAEDCGQWEYPTLEYLRQQVSTLTEPAAIGYIHLKGAGRPHYAEVADWRRLMEFFIIDNYQHCVKWLARDHNVVGCNWTPVSWIKPHFSGNFWWAESQYIKTLPPLPHPKDCHAGAISAFTGQHYDGVERFRFDHECWITSGKYKQKEMYSSGIIHYHAAWPEARYINTVFEP